MSNDMNLAANIVTTRRGLMRLGAAAVSIAGLAGCAQNAGNGAHGAKSQHTNIAVTQDTVRFVGRTCQKDGVVWLPQSGSAIEFKVVGVGVKLGLAGDDSVGNESAMLPRFAVLVNGEVVVDDRIDMPSRTVEVPLEPSQESVVEVIHLSEANFGAIGVRSITVEAADAAVAKPTDARDLSIEFIGDSITCAYGVEASSNDEKSTTSTENFMKSYAYLTAQALNANCSAVCYSGFGVMSGYSGDGERNANMVIPPLYGLVAAGYDQPWDFSAHTSDVVVINIGTNDFTYTGNDEDRMREFSQAYESFLNNVRAQNPNAHIVCTLGTMWGCEALYPTLEQAVDAFKTQTGDTKVTCYLSSPLDKSVDRLVMNGHPDEKGHQKIADELTEVIRGLLA